MHNVTLHPRVLQDLCDYPAWRQYARLGLLIVLCWGLGWLSYTTSYIVASIFLAWCQGFLMVCCLVAAHDCAHDTFVKQRQVCRILGAVISAPLLVNFSLYRYLHFTHHRLANFPGDTQRPRTYTSVGHYLLAVLHWKFPFRFFQFSLFAFIGRYPDSVKTHKQRQAVLLDGIVLWLTLFMMIGFTIAFPKVMLWGYWLPVVCYLMLTFFLTTAEHTGCDMSKNAMKNARSVHAGPLFRFLFWQFNYHAEHHEYPTVPSSNLHRLYLLIGDQEQHPSDSYTCTHWAFILSIYQQRHKGRKI
tara:strand:+ start:10233 stop:11135 length:903 start_codon:yes stop_codon:yes gene_type:complete